MKKFIICLALPYLFSMPLAAQEASKGVMRLSADEYTSFLLGEYQLPEGMVIATLADSKEVTSAESSQSGDRTTSTFNPNPDGLELVPLNPAEAQAMAVQIYFKFVEGNVSRLGYSNALRLAMGELSLSHSEAAGFIDFATSSVKEFESLLVQANVENCEIYSGQLAAATKSEAVKEMSRAESQLNSVVIEYYDGISDRLDNALGTSVYDHISAQLRDIASSLKSFRLENMGFEPSAVDTAADRYNSMCSRFIGQR